MPHQTGAVTQDIRHDVRAIALAVGAGENKDSKIHER